MLDGSRGFRLGPMYLKNYKGAPRGTTDDLKYRAPRCTRHGTSSHCCLHTSWKTPRMDVAGMLKEDAAEEKARGGFDDLFPEPLLTFAPCRFVRSLYGP